MHSLGHRSTNFHAAFHHSGCIKSHSERILIFLSLHSDNEKKWRERMGEDNFNRRHGYQYSAVIAVFRTNMNALLILQISHVRLRLLPSEVPIKFSVPLCLNNNTMNHRTHKLFQLFVKGPPPNIFL